MNMAKTSDLLTYGRHYPGDLGYYAPGTRRLAAAGGVAGVRVINGRTLVE